MNKLRYLEQRAIRAASGPTYRPQCMTCFQTEVTCFCHLVQPFEPTIRFVILIHPLEARRRIATGLMSHLCLKGSLLIRGDSFAESKLVNEVIDDPNGYCVVLYPGPTALDLSSHQVRSELGALNKKLTVFVIDGTWRTAKKTLRLSPNLSTLPRISFSQAHSSRFRVRRQPAPGCLSTIEAIHRTLELMQNDSSDALESHKQDNLLQVFDYVVERQLHFIEEKRRATGGMMFRR